MWGVILYTGGVGCCIPLQVSTISCETPHRLPCHPSVSLGGAGRFGGGFSLVWGLVGATIGGFRRCGPLYGPGEKIGMTLGFANLLFSELC